MKKRKKIPFQIFTILFLILSLFFGNFAYQSFLPGAKTDILIKEIKNKYVEEEVKSDWLNRGIDWEGLKSINSNIVGWITIPNTTIDYPILKGSDDSFYLTHDTNDNYNTNGSVFMYHDDDINRNADPLIFGHMEPNGINRMFGELRYYLSSAKYREQRNIAYVYTPEINYKVQLYSVIRCRYDDDIFTNFMEPGSVEYFNRIDTLKRRNEFSDIPSVPDSVQWGDSKSFLLATCNGTVGTPYRTVLSFVAVKQKWKI